MMKRMFGGAGIDLAESEAAIEKTEKRTTNMKRSIG